MPTAYSKAILTGSTDGKPVVVAATTSTGTTIHTAVTGTTNFHELYLIAYNVTATDCLLTMMYGATETVTMIPARSVVEVTPGIPLHNATVVKAFGAVANSIHILGYANVLTVT